MKTIKLFLIVLIVPLLGACATIPQESVDLSTEVGIGLKKQHESQVDLVNLHFSIKIHNHNIRVRAHLNSSFFRV